MIDLHKRLADLESDSRWVLRQIDSLCLMRAFVRPETLPDHHSF